jgi:hypothetical protein
MHYHHYGITLEKMIERVADYEEGEERNELIRLIANHMKKCFLTWNKEVVDNRKIFEDLREISNGKLDFTDDSFKLIEARDVFYPNNNKKNNRPKNRK